MKTQNIYKTGRMDREMKDKIEKLLYVPKLFRDSIYCFVKLGYWDVSWRFLGLPLIQKHRTSHVIIGKKLKACSKAKFNTIGVYQKVIIKAVVPNSIIKIGRNLGVSGATISGKSITIGNNVLIGSGALISDTDAHPIHYLQRDDDSYIESKPIVIEDDVFIGARAIVLKGVTIGKGSVVGAGSVVTSNIPEMSIAAGNPARILKQIPSLPLK